MADTRKIVSETPDVVTYQDSAEIGTVLGEVQNPPIGYTFQWDEYKNVAALRAAGKFPSDDTVRELANSVSQRNAMSGSRAKASAEAIAKVKDSTEYKRGEAVKSLVALGLSKDAAEAIVASQAS